MTQTHSSLYPRPAKDRKWNQEKMILEQHLNWCVFWVISLAGLKISAGEDEVWYCRKKHLKSYFCFLGEQHQRLLSQQNHAEPGALLLLDCIQCIPTWAGISQQMQTQKSTKHAYTVWFSSAFFLQYPLSFVYNFSQWMCSHAWLYRLLACMDVSELSASAELVTKGARILVRKSNTQALHNIFLCYATLF